MVLQISNFKPLVSNPKHDWEILLCPTQAPSLIILPPMPMIKGMEDAAVAIALYLPVPPIASLVMSTTDSRSLLRVLFHRERTIGASVGSHIKHLRLIAGKKNRESETAKSLFYT